MHSAKNSKELADMLSRLQVLPGQKLVSYDVTALFTSVPIKKALDIIGEKLMDDPSFHDKTHLDVTQVIQLLGVLPEYHILRI